MTLLESVSSDLSLLTPDELAAFRYILDRVLVVGRASYSPWVAADETRDMDKEGADEGGDLCVYAGFGAVLKHIKQQRMKKQRVTAFASALDEQFDTSEGGDV